MGNLEHVAIGARKRIVWKRRLQSFESLASRSSAALDIRDEASIEDFVSAVQDNLGEPTGVNNAGGQFPSGAQYQTERLASCCGYKSQWHLAYDTSSCERDAQAKAGEDH